MNLVEEIKKSYKRGSSLHKLIYINLGVFLMVKIIFIFLFLFNIQDAELLVLDWLALPTYLPELLTRFWTPFTYMFLHERFLHILFNLLWLYWFGEIFLEYFDQKKLVSLYLLGGLSGALLNILAFNLFPVFEPILRHSLTLGASASVMAIVIAIAAYVPNYIIRLVLIGPVKIKYIAIAALVFSSLLDFAENPGGSIAHIGGALFGFIYVSQFKKGKDMAKGFNKVMDSVFRLFKPRSKMKVSYKKKTADKDMDYNAVKAEEQKNVDRILEKISKAGYESLTKKEKEILFKMSNNNKQ